MNDSLYIAATGMQAQQRNLETIANNLANVATPGFKKARITFHELIHAGAAQGTPAPAGVAEPGAARGAGIGIDGVGRDFTGATLAQSGGPLDVAIDGAGFFEVTLPDGTHGYCRGGSLQVTKDGFLATAHGYVLHPAIHVSADAALAIGADGQVTVRTPNSAQPLTVGQLELANFAHSAALKSVAPGIYVPTEASGQAVYGKPGSAGLGRLAQGSLENSNVAPVDEMVNLMLAQRAYELSSKVIQASDEMMNMANNLRR
jgi:flagellar basal-body rod protein FlgG